MVMGAPLTSRTGVKSNCQERELNMMDLRQNDFMPKLARSPLIL
jgi:hypothetical protein